MKRLPTQYLLPLMAAAAFAASPLHAQPSGPPEGGPGPGPDGPPPGPNIERLTKDLSLTEEQVAKIQKILDDQKAAMDALRKEENSSRETQKEKFRALMESAKKSISEVLTDEQKAKWEEICQRPPEPRGDRGPGPEGRMRQGPRQDGERGGPPQQMGQRGPEGASCGPEAQGPGPRFDKQDRSPRGEAPFLAGLNLTKEQREKVKEVFDANKGKVEALRQEARQKMEALQQEIAAQIRPILTAEQQAVFDAQASLRKAREALDDKKEPKKDAKK